MSDVKRIRDYFRTASWRPSAARRELIDERFQLMLRVTRRLGIPFEDLTICDVGCGDGSDLVRWRNEGVPETGLAGTELMVDRAARARAVLPRADIRVVDGYDFPFPDAAFSLCSASLVLSTALGRQARARLLTEMDRVTAAGGAMVVYDFVVRKPWNSNVRAVVPSELRAIHRQPDTTYRAAPFLPAFELVMRLPESLAKPATAILPRTHRLWVWHKGASGAGSR